MLYMEGVTRQRLVLIINVHKSAFHPHTSKVLCKPPMFSKHPHSPKRKCGRAEMCPASPRSLHGAGSDAWQMSLEGISVLERSQRCGQWDFPSSHTSCTSFLHRWLDLKALAFSLDCVSLGGAPSLCFLMHYYWYCIFIAVVCIQGVGVLIKFSSRVVQSSLLVQSLRVMSFLP